MRSIRARVLNLMVQYRSTRFDARLVKTKKIGRVRTCKLGKARLEEEAAWIERYHRLWDDARFDALDRVVEELN